MLSDGKKSGINKRTLGKQWEETCESFLKANGVRIIAVNFFTKAGEIDMIGWDEKILVFFEIKYRKNLSGGYPAESVNLKKQQSVCRASDYFRLKNNISPDTGCRYDVISVLRDSNNIKWYKNAFEYVGFCR